MDNLYEGLARENGLDTVSPIIGPDQDLSTVSGAAPSIEDRMDAVRAELAKPTVIAQGGGLRVLKPGISLTRWRQGV